MSVVMESDVTTTEDPTETPEDTDEGEPEATPEATPEVEPVAEPDPAPAPAAEPDPTAVTASVGFNAQGLYTVDVQIRHGDQTVVSVNGRAVWQG